MPYWQRRLWWHLWAGWKMWLTIVGMFELDGIGPYIRHASCQTFEHDGIFDMPYLFIWTGWHIRQPYVIPLNMMVYYCMPYVTFELGSIFGHSSCHAFELNGIFGMPYAIPLNKVAYFAYEIQMTSFHWILGFQSYTVGIISAEVIWNFPILFSAVCLQLCLQLIHNCLLDASLWPVCINLNNWLIYHIVKAGRRLYVHRGQINEFPFLTE